MDYTNLSDFDLLKMVVGDAAYYLKNAHFLSRWNSDCRGRVSFATAIKNLRKSAQVSFLP